MKVSEERPEAVAAEQRHEKAKSEFLAQKVSVKNLKLDARQISILQNNVVFPRPFNPPTSVILRSPILSVRLIS